MSTIQQTLTLFLSGVLEVRALGCWDRSPEYKQTRSGYFDNVEAAEKAVQDLEKRWHPDGIYLTLNPVRPELLARSSNRIRKAGKDETTKNEEITARRWLLLDFDPKRPAGISATDSEMLDAQEAARICGCWLVDSGFPSPVVAMSGNGWHLLYRVDRPAGCDLVRRVVAKVADKYSSETVSADSKVFNAARITKLYGTLARKGDPTPDRPHRRSELVEVPKEIDVVSETALRQVAGEDPEPSSAVSDSPDRLRVDFWLARHGVQALVHDSTLDGLERWFIPCPGVSAHTSKNADTDCCITQEPSGKMGGHCFHDSCGMKDWKTIRDAVGPLEWEDFNEPIQGVDLSHLLVKTVPPPLVEDERLPPFPKGILSCGGTLERIIDYNLRTAIYPMQELALAGALALLSLVTGRRVEDRWELRTNAYILGLADAGSGKNHSRQVNNKILAAMNRTDLLGASKLKSSSGLISELVEHPATLFQIDEMSRLLQTMKDPRHAPHLYDIGTVMLEAYSESANPAWKAGAYADRKKNPCVNFPHLVLYGVAVSAEFWQSLTKSNLTDGLLGRLMPFESRDRIESRDPTKTAPDETLLAEVGAWLQESGPLITRGKAIAQRIHHTPEAWDRYQQHFKAIEKSRPGESSTAFSLWKRTGEKTGKLAMLSACSRVPPISGAWPTVEIRDVDWAIRLSNWLTRSVLIKAGLYVSETPHEQNLIRLLRELEDWKSKTQLSRDLRWMKARDREELIRGALADGYIVDRKTESGSAGGRPLIEYKRMGKIGL